MKLALTGSEGMLGHDVQRAFSDFEIVPFTIDTLDITSLDSVVKAVRAAKPDVLIHCAAFTDVDRCESDPELAYLVNGVGARNVAMACEDIRCPIFYISTDYVFDGTKEGPYDEWDQTNPVNRYGLSKLMGERYVASLTNRHYIVRTSWLYGRNGKNFVDTIVRLLSERDSIDVVDDQRGCPTLTVDLALTLRKMVGRGYGIYHVTNSGNCSWFEFASEIASIKGIAKKVSPTTSDKFLRPAKRPSNSVLGKTMLKLEGLPIPRQWQDAVAEYLK